MSETKNIEKLEKFEARTAERKFIRKTNLVYYRSQKKVVMKGEGEASELPLAPICYATILTSIPSLNFDISTFD